MTANAIFKQLYDPTGAKMLLSSLGVTAEMGVTVAGGASKLLFLGDDGCFILDEFPGARRAAKHTIEFVPFKRVGMLSVDLTDAARRSEEPTERLRGLTASLTYESALIDGQTTIEIDGDAAMEAVQHDEDVVRLWGLTVQLQRAVIAAGRPLLITAQPE